MQLYKRGGLRAADNLFFNDWSRLAFKDRRHHWDTKFQLLKSFPTVLITRHSAFLTEEALANIAATTVLNLQVTTSGQLLINFILNVMAHLLHRPHMLSCMMHATVHNNSKHRISLGLRKWKVRS